MLADFAQLFHDVVVAARELCLVTAQSVERMVVREGLTEELLAVFVLVLFLLGGAVVEFVDDGSFDASEAFEPPGNVDELVDEVFFDDADRPEFEEKFAGVTVELVGVFAGDERVLGSEAVFEGIERGALFAFGGPGAG